MKKWGVIFLVLATTFCTPNSDEFNKDSLEALSSSREVDFSSINNLDFGYIHSVSSDSNGNIYVLDWGRQSVLIFTENGKLIREFENRGEGPGEYLSIREIYIKNDFLYIVDDNNLRISKFKISNSDGDLTHIKDTLYPDRAFTRIEHFFVIDEDTYAFVFLKDGFSAHNLWDDKFAGLQLFDWKRQKYNEILEVPGREYFRFENERGWGIRPLAFGTYPYFMFHEGEFYYGDNSEFNIDKYNLSGELVTTFQSINIDPISVPQNERMGEINDDYYVDRNIQKDAREQLPEEWRIYNSFLIDDENRLWISMNQQGHSEGGLWWVFDEFGNGLYKLELEVPSKFLLIHNNNIYGIETNDLGVQSLVKYSISGLEANI
ncbi:hypothetical protein BH23THE1_BH23THE1_22580 [soil metagenome]